MTTNQIIKKVDWEEIFGNSSQVDNLYDFLKNKYGLVKFISYIYEDSKNKEIISKLNKTQIKKFKRMAKEVFNLSPYAGIEYNTSWRLIKKHLKSL